jgi:hypothetical protein
VAGGGEIHDELRRLRRLPRWGRAQSDDWDAHSRFIYSIHSLHELRCETKRVAREAGLPVEDFARYVIHRWYNYHTHELALELFARHSRVRREPDVRHPTIDFYLDGEPFDLKLTRFPRTYEEGLDRARARPVELARWLYERQSQQGRHHAANRLFLVFHWAGAPERTWELRRDVELVACEIEAFLARPRLFAVPFTAPSGERVAPRAGVIFCLQGLLV